MLSPKRVKYRKTMRGKMKGVASRGTELSFGEFGIQALESAWITNRQLEAARVAMTRKIKRGGRVWLRVYPDKPFTKKPAETRMGSGKGNVEGWVAVVLAGRMIFEMGGVERELAMEALRVAAQKLPLRIKICEVDKNG
jgi:large subunit ribosomal protein L16